MARYHVEVSKTCYLDFEMSDEDVDDEAPTASMRENAATEIALSYHESDWDVEDWEISVAQIEEPQ